MLAAVVVFISKAKIGICLEKTRRPYASPSVKWMVTKMMNLRAFFDIYEEVFSKPLFWLKLKKEDFLLSILQSE